MSDAGPSFSQRFMRVCAYACVMVLLGGAAFVGLGEIVLRVSGFSSPIWYRPDAELGWSLRPGVEGWFTKEGRAYVRVNEAGFRDRSHALAKPPGVYRIAVIGDSQVEALHVDMRATFWSQLEARLGSCAALHGRPVEVLAFGASGYGTAQEYLLLRERALAYHPDLVLLAFMANDLEDNSRELTPEIDRPFFVPDGAGLKIDSSFRQLPQFARRSSALYQAYRSASDRLRVVQLVQAARDSAWTLRRLRDAQSQAQPHLRALEPATPPWLFGPPKTAAWERTWLATERLIVRMNTLAAENRARLVVVVMTHSAQVNPDREARAELQQALGVDDLFYLNRRLEALGKRAGIPVVSLGPEMQKEAQIRQISFHGFANHLVGFGHWNEAGHRAGSELIASRLCADLPAPVAPPTL